MAMYVYNSLTDKKEEFIPLKKNKVGMYVCGVTVYDEPHIGHGRGGFVFDVIKHYLEYRGYQLKYVKNITDVDDKIIERARQETNSTPASDLKGAVREIAARYLKCYQEDMSALGVREATIEPKATEHIEDMIELIRRLEKKGFAYEAGGSVYFRVSKFKDYGELSNQKTSEMKEGLESAPEEEKEDPLDFALWKAAKEEEPTWDSPWGKGRPGWHIECSAMSMKYLGESFDMHTGGVDNMFPHHDDEIAQSEGATGKPFVKYWLHSAHLVVDGKKMSKSLGNFYTLREVMERGYHGREVRYVLLSAHYRQSLNFTFEAVEAARASLARLDEFADRLRECKTTGEGLPTWAAKAKAGFEAALNDDLNIAEALASLFDMVHDGNRAMDGGDADWSADAVIALLASFDAVLGVLEKPETAVDSGVDALLEARAQARAEKNWAESDRIRDALRDMGWEVRDSAEGQKLRSKAES